jgi:hypothetical protein
MEGPASSITTEIAITSWQASPLGSFLLMMRCTLAVREGSFATDRCAMKIGPCPQCPDSDGWPSRRRPVAMGQEPPFEVTVPHGLATRFPFNSACGRLTRVREGSCIDLNPIEMPYGKFKAHIRKLAERTGEGVRRAIRSFLPSLGGRECAKLFQACRLCFI